jgi:BolA protein
MENKITVAQEIEQKLAAAFDVSQLEVTDESDLHIGHAGRPEGGQSHFRVRMVASDLKNMSRIARHRAIHTAIGSDLISRIHALALEVSG